MVGAARSEWEEGVDGEGGGGDKGVGEVVVVG